MRENRTSGSTGEEWKRELHYRSHPRLSSTLPPQVARKRQRRFV